MATDDLSQTLLQKWLKTVSRKILLAETLALIFPHKKAETKQIFVSAFR